MSSRFTDRERAIYQSPFAGSPPIDPLALNRRLWQATRGRLYDLLADAEAAAPVTAETKGDITRGPENYVVAAAAEEELARAARQAFGLAPFPEGPLDAAVLDALDHFLGWLEGKD